MNIEMLEKFITELKPIVTLPIHIDDYAHFNSKKQDFTGKYRVLNNGETVTIS